jgi:hypothetical protein
MGVDCEVVVELRVVMPGMVSPPIGGGPPQPVIVIHVIVAAEAESGGRIDRPARTGLVVDVAGQGIGPLQVPDQLAHALAVVVIDIFMGCAGQHAAAQADHRVAIDAIALAIAGGRPGGQGKQRRGHGEKAKEQARQCHGKPRLRQHRRKSLKNQ